MITVTYFAFIDQAQVPNKAFTDLGIWATMLKSQRCWKGVYWFHLVRPSFLLSVSGQNRVHSVSSTILAGSTSYWQISSSYFRRCLACNVVFKIWSFAKFFKSVTVLFWLPIWHESIVWVNMGWRLVSSKRRRSSCLFFVSESANYLHLPLYICLNALNQYWSGDGLPLVRCQAITWANAGLLSVGTLPINFSEIGTKIQNLLYLKMHLKSRLQKGGHSVQGEVS